MGIAPNATVGAAWGTNLTGRPANIAGLGGAEIVNNAAVSANNLIQNPGAELGTTAGWSVGSGMSAVGAGAALSLDAYNYTSGAQCFAITKAATSDGGTAGHIAVPVKPGQTYYIGVSLLGSTGVGGVYIQLRMAPTYPTNGIITDAIISGAGTSHTLAAANYIAAPTVWTGYYEPYVIPAGMYWASLCITNFVSGPLQLDFDDAVISPAIDPSSGSVLARGSIPSAIPSGSFTYASTTSSVTVSWAAFTVYRIDGTTISVSTGSLAITGLALNTSYKVYPYIADGGGTTGVISFVSGVGSGSGSPTAAYSPLGDAAGAATMVARGNIPMNGFLVSTTASGSASGGGGGYSCLHPKTTVMTSIGVMTADELEVGDMVPTPTGEAEIRTISRGRNVTWYEVQVNYSREGSWVTPSHVFYTPEGKPVSAQTLTIGQFLKTAGDHVQVTGLRLFRDDVEYVGLELDNPHLHYLGEAELLTHNGASKP